MKPRLPVIQNKDSQAANEHGAMLLMGEVQLSQTGLQLPANVLMTLEGLRKIF